MKTGGATSLLLAMAACIMGIASWRNGVACLRAWQRPKVEKKETKLEIIPALLLARIDTTLRLAASFAGSVPSYPSACLRTPFRLVGEHRSPPEALPQRAVERKTLILKGLLITSARPLAIVETEDGSTSICGVGDSVSGYHIVRIEGNKVIARDRWGIITLSQKD